MDFVTKSEKTEGGAEAEGPLGGGSPVEGDGRRSGGRIWRTLQVVFFALGVALLVLLVVNEELGLDLFWNLWIPLAPALLLLVPGFWRNVCPLASGSLLCRRLGFSLGFKVGRRAMVRLRVLGVLGLLVIVPLRHPFFDQDASLTLLLLAILAFSAFGLGLVFEWKAGWCAGACPIHPVEKLYGRRPLQQFSNMQCDSCEGCVPRCPDSIPSERPFRGKNSGVLRALDEGFFPGFFPGFVWGWFQVPNLHRQVQWEDLVRAYSSPLLAGAFSLVLFLVLIRILRGKKRGLLQLLFGALTIGCYYWFRLPALLGFGPFPGDGMLVDLRGSLPSWFVPMSHGLVVALVLAWFLWALGRMSPSWLRRPRFSFVPHRPGSFRRFRGGKEVLESSQRRI